jgi:hypothetical protein
VWAAVVNAPNLFAHYVAPWDDNAYGLDLRAARQLTTNHHRKTRIKAQQLLVEPQSWATLDYPTILDANAQASLSWIVPDAGTAHGLSTWFDTELLPGIGYSNAPAARLIRMYSQIFFPWTHSVELSAGDEVQVTFRVQLIRDHYVWSWQTYVGDSTSTHVKARFAQASFACQPMA